MSNGAFVRGTSVAAASGLLTGVRGGHSVSVLPRLPAPSWVPS